MSADNSTPSVPSGKPAKPNKPSPDFPLVLHAAGVWAKEIRGKLHYFGPWDGPDSAIARYLEQKDDLHVAEPYTRRLHPREKVMSPVSLLSNVEEENRQPGVYTFVAVYDDKGLKAISEPLSVQFP
jgi:hypothetical protein